MIEKDLRLWIEGLVSGLKVHYAHVDKKPGDRFGFLVRSGDEPLDTIDGTGEAEIIYFDFELHDKDLARLVSTAGLITAARDYRGPIGSAGWVEDIAIDDHRDDYESLVNADMLPPYMKAFRITVTCYTGAA